MRLEQLSFAEWDEQLPQDPLEIFYSADALRIIDDHWSGELRLYGGYKGQQLVGLAPVFIRQHRLGRLVASPPIGFGIDRLGPVVMPTSPKQRKKEAVNRKFITKLIEEIDATDRFTLFRMSCDIQYDDPRPFQWAGLDITPAFTYRLDLDSTTPDEVLSSFSRDLRRDIKKRDEVGITVRREPNTSEYLERIYRAMQDRFREQGTEHPISWAFFRDLVGGLEDNARVYVAESDDGEFLSGMVVLYANGTAYYWKGGAKPSGVDCSVSPNSLLHWQIIEDTFTDPTLESITAYDFYTAKNSRLSRYKSSFGGRLVPHYLVESNGVEMKLAKGLYKKSKQQSIPFSNSLVVEKLAKGN